MNTDWLDDDDSDNPIILDKCIVEAELTLFEKLPQDTDFSAFIACFQRFYDAFIDAYTDAHYWTLHAKHYDYIL